MTKKFELSPQQEAEMIASIKAYFLEERDEELGDLAARLILDFISNKLAPHFYNKGVADAHQYLSERLEDVFEIQRY
ncbi:DUF2164 domain-containing protein [Priestia koreensis]|uniref:DUF2164 domain-containing protein n=1 Tax=Priestia koreensis TaxID=284581 RepID=A0A0M0KVD8_9BACI|nr:DUF2164 domain-containing protein [Priestia koreensis]KOO42790.1 hypothetical protein AMD01_16740 [Priestia koreensis]MCM3005459.1 DUF2164 domain-containing protein [Priestia koreensis]